MPEYQQELRQRIAELAETSEALRTEIADQRRRLEAIEAHLVTLRRILFHERKTDLYNKNRVDL